jgi:DNA-binding response OmpR family regulator
VSRNGKLICLTGPRTGTEYELSQEITTLGRSADSTIQVEDSFVSRKHAEIRRIGNNYQICDLNSKNGMVVNDAVIAPGSTAWLDDGAEVILASTHFRFMDPSATVTAPSLHAVRNVGLRLDAATRQVFVDGVLLEPPLSVKQFDLLYYLYHFRGRVVSKDEIAEAVWPEANGEVFDANIDRMISRVRSRIEPESAEEPRFIATVRGYGYQMLPEE